MLNPRGEDNSVSLRLFAFFTNVTLAVASSLLSAPDRSVRHLQHLRLRITVLVKHGTHVPCLQHVNAPAKLAFEYVSSHRLLFLSTETAWKVDSHQYTASLTLMRWRWSSHGSNPFFSAFKGGEVQHNQSVSGCISLRICGLPILRDGFGVVVAIVRLVQAGAQGVHPAPQHVGVGSGWWLDVGVGGWEGRGGGR